MSHLSVIVMGAHGRDGCYTTWGCQPGTTVDAAIDAGIDSAMSHQLRVEVSDLDDLGRVVAVAVRRGRTRSGEAAWLIESDGYFCPAFRLGDAGRVERFVPVA